MLANYYCLVLIEINCLLTLIKILYTVILITVSSNNNNKRMACCASCRQSQTELRQSIDSLAEGQVSLHFASYFIA